MNCYELRNGDIAKVGDVIFRLDVALLVLLGKDNNFRISGGKLRVLSVSGKIICPDNNSTLPSVWVRKI